MKSSDWKPIKALIDLEQELERTFASIIHEPWEEAAQRDAWSPAVDVDETDEEYLITADIPGVAWTHLSLKAEKHRLILRGERAAVRRTRTANRVQVERYCGRFARTVNFEHPVDPDSVDAELKEGVLHIHVKKLKHEDAEDEES